MSTAGTTPPRFAKSTAMKVGDRPRSAAHARARATMAFVWLTWRAVARSGAAAEIQWLTRNNGASDGPRFSAHVISLGLANPNGVSVISLNAAWYHDGGGPEFSENTTRRWFRSISSPSVGHDRPV